MLRSSPINCIILAGQVARAGSLRRSARSVAYLTFSLSFPEYQRSLETGELEECASFIECVIYGKLAEGYENELSKGRRVAVQGRLHWDKFIDSQNSNKSKHQIRVDRIYLDANSSEVI